MSDPLGADLRLEGLCKALASRAGTTTILDHVDLAVPAGSIFTVLGPEGCGKTMLLRCIAGLEAPDAGTIRLGETVLWSPVPKGSVPAERRELGLVPCPPRLWPRQSALDNVALALRFRHLSRAEIQTRSRRMLALVGLQKSADRSVGSLDAASQWFVALARVLAGAPRLVLLDDPLAGLPAESRSGPRRLLRQCLQAMGATALLATRSRADALAQSDAMAVMHAGRIIETGTPEALYFGATRPLVARYLGRANLLEATVRGTEQDFLLVRTLLGTIHCQRRDLAEGTTGMLSIQPEFIRVSRPDAGPGFNVIEGRVQTLEFAGEFYDAEIAVNDRVIRARAAPELHLTEGDPVEIRLDPAHCRFLDA